MTKIRILLVLTQMQLLAALVSPLRGRDTRRDQRGASGPETAIIVGILAALAIAIGAIIVNKFTGAAEAIPTQ